MALSRLGQSLSPRDIMDLIRDDLQEVERQIALESIASVSAVTTISQYLNGNGGKRLRPILLLLSSKVAAGNSNGSATRLGAVVEIIHTATLVHDDIIDVAETRRGKPSTNIVWGNHTSVLAGDWLYMQAFQIALRERNFHVLDILIALTQMMVEGELLQLERLGNIEVTEADYMELVDRKTAGLFAACSRLGAVVAGADESTEAQLADYGWNLGMAFQLIDDVLDFTASESVLGKPVGSDLREGKVTLPLVYTLQSCTPEERKRIAEVLADRSYSRVEFSAIHEMVTRYSGVEKTRERALAFAHRAKEIIGTFPESAHQKALFSVAELVTNREY